MRAADRSAVILIVDDEGNDVFLLQRALRKAGVRLPIRVARDGEEAVEYLSGTGRFQDRRKFPVPCLAVLDLKLPKMNGLQVLRWLRGREEFRDLPVVMVTSGNENGDRERALHDGVEAYHVKPVSFDELVQLASEIKTEAEDHCKEAKPCPEDP